MIFLLLSLSAQAETSLQTVRAWGVGPRSVAKEWWFERQKQIPIDSNPLGELYLAKMARVMETIAEVKVKHPKGASSSTSVHAPWRLNGVIADTLNISAWHQGQGYYILHGGLIREVIEPHVMVFFTALEMAHGLLGHGATDKKPRSLPLLSRLFFDDGTVDLWTADGFAAVALNDPLYGGPSRSLVQEIKALEYVAGLFDVLGLDYEGNLKKVEQSLKYLGRHNQAAKGYPGKNNVVPWLQHHAQLSLALKQMRPPVLRLNDQLTASLPKGDEVLDIISRYRAIFIARPRQTYPWFLDIMPYVGSIRDGRAVQLSPSEEKALAAAVGSDEAAMWLKYRGLLQTTRVPQAEAELSRYVANHPYSAPHQILLARSRLLTDSERPRCLEIESVWQQFNRLREMALLHCLIVDGRLTDAKKRAEQYFRQFPNDWRGDFWTAWLQFRMRTAPSDAVAKFEKRFGPRPASRALALLDAGHGYQAARVQALVQESSDETAYDMEEQGVLDLSRAWALQIWNDHKWKGFMSRAEKRFFPARRHWRLLPFIAPPPPVSAKER
jgi:hypothetical protein